MSGKHIELFLVDGSPGGLTTAEILNWTGVVVRAPRRQLPRLAQRRELAGSCVYLLLGADDESGGQRCYIGETDDVKARLRQHDVGKSFWQQVVVITSKDANLTKAHGRYLEARLIDLAQQAGRVALENATTPPLQPLPEAHVSDMDFFVDQLQIVLPVLGVDAFRGTETVRAAGADRDELLSPVFHLRNERLGIHATAQHIDGEFVMLAGSTLVREWHGVGNAGSTRRAYSNYRAQHQRLVTDGALDVAGPVAVLTRNVVFSSPSTAGAVAQGRSCNGRIEWVSAEGTTFGTWESHGRQDAPSGT